MSCPSSIRHRDSNPRLERIFDVKSISFNIFISHAAADDDEDDKILTKLSLTGLDLTLTRMN